MPFTTRPDSIPADSVDVTEDVLELKDQLHDLFAGKNITVIAMAIGSIVGEAFDDPETTKQVLTIIAEMSATVFLSSCSPEEGASIQ